MCCTRPRSVRNYPVLRRHEAAAPLIITRDACFLPGAKLAQPPVQVVYRLRLLCGDIPGFRRVRVQIVELELRRRCWFFGKEVAVSDQL